MSDSYAYALLQPEPWDPVQTWDQLDLTTTINNALFVPTVSASNITATQVSASNITATQVGTSNLGACNVTASQVTTSNLGACNVTATQVTSCNLDTSNVYIQGSTIQTTAPSGLTGFIDQTWVTTDPTNNYRQLGKDAGSVAANVVAFSEAAVILADPLTSPAGIAGFDAAEVIFPTGGYLGYDLALETCISLGQSIGSIQGAHLGAQAGGEAAVLGASNDAEAIALGTAAGSASAVTDAYLPGAGWAVKMTPPCVSLGVLAGNIAGTLAQTRGNTTIIDEHTATIGEHTTTLATLTTDVATLTTDLAAVTADVVTLTADAAAQAIELEVHATDITGLQSDMVAVQDSAAFTSNALPNYLPLAGGTMTGPFTASSNILMATPFLLRATASNTEGQLSITPQALRYITLSNTTPTTQFSITSNGMFPLSTPYLKILGNTESSGNFGRVECSAMSGFSTGLGLTPPSVSPYAVNWFNVSSNSELSTFANDLGYMSKFVNSNAEIGYGFKLKKDGSVVDANNYTLFDTGGTLRRQGASVGGPTGVTISPTGYLSVGKFQIYPDGTVTMNNRTVIDTSGRFYPAAEESGSSYRAPSAVRPSGGLVFSR